MLWKEMTKSKIKIKWGLWKYVNFKPFPSIYVFSGEESRTADVKSGNEGDTESMV